MINVDSLSMAYEKNIILRELSFSVEQGTITTIIGPNGCGKTTLLRALARSKKPLSGRVTYCGRDITRIDSRTLAREMAILPQNLRAPDDFTVRDLVGTGRFPDHGLFGGMKEPDYRAIDEALEAVGMTDFAHRRVSTLSGGERQRGWIAMCLAQQPKVLLLDEPTTFLDICYQYEVLRLIRTMNRDLGLTIVMILHDLNQAARFSDRILALHDGALVCDGTPREVLTADMLQTVFSIRGLVTDDPVNRCPMVIPCDEPLAQER
ncbi:MAG: ABC transporter ATP-binding protein [Oscillospiraceae bacterium]